jgi:hypothetical protein
MLSLSTTRTLTTQFQWLAFRSIWANVLTATTVLSAGGHCVFAQTYLTFDYVGSALTEVWGVDGLNLVGWHQVSPGPGQPLQGFLYDGTTLTDLDYPDAGATQAFDVSGSNIVGTYRDASFVQHGFLYDGTDWSSLDYPGSFQSYAYGVDGNHVVGWYLPGGGPGAGIHGFLYDGTSYTQLDYPGSISTQAYGISGGKIVGEYAPGGGPGGGIHGFLYDGSNYSQLDYPGSTSTRAYGISGDNIVGSYRDASGATHGFVYDGVDWYSIDYPLSARSRALGVDGDNIVGAYQAGPGTHGFQTTKPVPPNEYVFKFTGEITSVDDELGWFNGAFAVGQAVEGSYNVLDGWFSNAIHFADNGTGDSDVIDVTFYNYHLEANDFGLPTAPAHMQIEVGGQVYETGLNEFRQDTYTLRITNDADGTFTPAGDEFAIQSSATFADNFNNFMDFPESNVPRTTFLLSLQDSSGTAITSFDLPLTAPELADFNRTIGHLSLSDFDGQVLAVVAFRIDSLNAVPEPAAGALLIVTFAALVPFNLRTGRRFES